MNTQAAIEAAKIAAETAARNAWITTIVTVIALLITSGISIWSVMRNSKIAKELGEKNLKSLEQKRYIDAISAERVKWINTLRGKFSEYIKLVHIHMHDVQKLKLHGEDGKIKLRDRYIEITDMGNQIHFALNTTEPFTQKILTQQKKINNSLLRKNISDFEIENVQVLLQDLGFLYQVVLKAEWKRVKEENKTGEEMNKEKMSGIYIEVAKRINNESYNKFFNQSKS